MFCYLYDVMLGIPVSVIGLSSKTMEMHIESNYKTEQFGDPFCKESGGIAYIIWYDHDHTAP